MANKYFSPESEVSHPVRRVVLSFPFLSNSFPSPNLIQPTHYLL